MINSILHSNKKAKDKTKPAQGHDTMILNIAVEYESLCRIKTWKYLGSQLERAFIQVIRILLKVFRGLSIIKFKLILLLRTKIHMITLRLNFKLTQPGIITTTWWQTNSQTSNIKFLTETLATKWCTNQLMKRVRAKAAVTFTIATPPYH